MRLRSLLISTVTVSAVAAADPTFEGYPIREESVDLQGFRGGNYIFPNEIYPDRWKPVLRDQKGVYIGVGTFRVFNTAVYNDFEHVFMLDVDEGITRFNRIVLGLIRECETREELLAYLSGYGITSGAKPPFENLPDGYWGKLPSPLREEYERGFILGDFRKPFRLEPELKALRDGEWKITNFMRGTDTNKNTITASDELYRIARRQVLSNRFTVVHGSISGLESVRDIAIALRKTNKVVSAFDISNVVGYLSGFQALSVNLSLLPFAPDAVILHTMMDDSFSLRPPGAKGDQWIYHASRVPRFQEQLNRAMKPSDDPFAPEHHKDKLYRNLKSEAVKLPNGLSVSRHDPCLENLRDTLKKGLD